MVDDDDPGDLIRRQLWNLPSTTTSSIDTHCTPFTLPLSGVISFANSAITLTTDAVFQPQCTGSSYSSNNTDRSAADAETPFYASTIPQTYVVGACTVIAWTLLIMLLITPRSSFMGGLGSQGGLSHGRGIFRGGNGGASAILGVGSRPWLQKVAALTVAISLTIATADTFKVAERQYNSGQFDALALRDQVLGSIEIRVTRVISDVFLWLAQVQTLIRLFPRHKEKVLIKWTGFALIILDTTFSCLNSFLINTQKRPRHFVDAIPALSYLFELALGLLYAAWVIYYSLTKRRYAFYHRDMRNICVIALLSLVAVLTPVVFFVTDVSNPDVASWGDYFRWVGAAAASVVVWEWVERIEALEREEKKDGILGREIFDGDEMLDVTPSEEVIWGRQMNEKRDGKDGDAGGPGGALEHGLNEIANRFRHKHQPARQHFPLGRAHSETTMNTLGNVGMNGNTTISFGNMPTRHGGQQQNVLGVPTPPPPIASPINRADTTSAASTVYVVHYDQAAEVPQPVRRRANPVDDVAATSPVASQDRTGHQSAAAVPKASEKDVLEEGVRPNEDRAQKATGHSKWANVTNPFKRKRTSPPAEIQKAKEAAGERRAKTPVHNFPAWDIRNRLGVVAAHAGEHFRDRRNGGSAQVDNTPVTVVPAQPRGSGRTWSPDLHARQQAAAQAQTGVGPRVGNSGETTGHESGHSNETTLTNNSALNPTQPQPEQTSTVDSSPLGAGGIAASPSPSTPTPNHMPSQSSQPSHPSNLSPAPPSILSGRPSPILRQHSHTQTQPPRADDLSPGASGSVTIVPAPRRSPIRASHTFTTESDVGGAGSNCGDTGSHRSHGALSTSSPPPHRQ